MEEFLTICRCQVDELDRPDIGNIDHICHGFTPILPLFFSLSLLLNLMLLYCKTRIGLARSPDRI